MREWARAGAQANHLTLRHVSARAMARCSLATSCLGDGARSQFWSQLPASTGVHNELFRSFAASNPAPS